MPVLSKPSAMAGASLTYITVGALINVWSGIRMWYLRSHAPVDDVQIYWCWGFLLTGTVLLLIGLAVGAIGRAARHAELPPAEVMPTEAKVEEGAALRAPIVAPVNPALPLAGNVAPMALPAQPPLRRQ